MSIAKRLAKNTAFMYFRMLFLIIISFYTSRIVLQQLGVEDFGLYNVVGSIVGMFSALRTLFSSSTQRFLNYEMGKGNQEQLNKVFNISLYINLLLSVVFFIVVELIGMWFLLYKINIDPQRLNTAIVVFQLSVIASIANIIVTTYDAEIIAHERMDFFAYISIFEGIMKLIIVFALSLTVIDKLKLYAILLTVVSIVVVFINAVYCHKNFSECRFRYYNDKRYLKSMAGFAIWNFFGKASSAVTQSGVNMLLNIFGGTTVNAARGIAMQLNTAINLFLNNINIVINPYCTKIYAEGQYMKFWEMFNLSSKLYFYLQLCLVIPLMIMCEFVLNVWLGQVPDYSVQFLKIILIWSLIRSLHSPIDILFKSKGDMKWYQICEGIVLSTPLLIGWFLLRCGYDYYWIFIMINIVEIINYVGIILLAKKNAGLNVKEYLVSVISKIILLVIPFIIISIIDNLYIFSIRYKVFEVILCELIIGIVFSTLILSAQERKTFISIIKR